MRTRWAPPEDAVLRRSAGLCTAAEIGAKLGRSRQAVHARAKLLGVNLTRGGEHHWRARLTELQVQMIAQLKDAGYTAAQIKEAFGVEVSTGAINDAAAGRTWRAQ